MNTIVFNVFNYINDISGYFCVWILVDLLYINIRDMNIRLDVVQYVRYHICMLKYVICDNKTQMKCKKYIKQT